MKNPWWNGTFKQIQVPKKTFQKVGIWKAPFFPENLQWLESMKFRTFWHGTFWDVSLFPPWNSCPWTVRPEIAPKGNRGLWCLVSGRASFSGVFLFKTRPAMGHFVGAKIFCLVGTLGFRRFLFLLHFWEVFSQVQERVVGFWFFPYGDFVVGDVATGVTSSVRSGRNCCRDRGEVIIREQFLLTSEEICRAGWAQFLRWKKRRKQVEIA